MRFAVAEEDSIKRIIEAQSAKSVLMVCSSLQIFMESIPL